LRAFYTIDDIIGNSASIEKLRHLLYKISNSELSILITGESGSGKELIAQSVHNLSNRKDSPFVAINCGAIPKELLESELFGHKKGSFTGAYNDRNGKLKEAEDGTIFLDEIGEMPLILQVKLLRIIQERRFSPLGSNKEETVKARIICATNKNLKKIIENGLFREDLYYRINGVEVHVPPLRERFDDIVVLAEYFLKKYALRSGKTRLKNIGETLKKRLIEYSWPGNVRELEGLIEREVVFSDDNSEKITHIAQDLVTEDKKITGLPTLDLKTLEKNALKIALNKCENISDAAKLLGISRATIYRKISKYGIDLNED